MRIIKSMQDIKLLKKVRAVNHDLLQELEKKLAVVHDNIKDGTSIEEFNMRKYGALIILEPGDNPADLEEIGLNPEDGGLIGAAPEWIDILEIADQRYYDMVIVLNNEYAITLICPEKALDQATKDWLEEESGIA